MKRSLVVTLLALLFFATACGQLFPTKIGDIVQNPRDYAGKDVTVSGEVTEVFSLILVRYFVIRDDTGQIPVITSRPVPRVGQKLKVKGVVAEAFAIGDRNMLVLMEKE